MTRVDYRDVVEVAAVALTEDRLLHGTFELCAVGDLNRHDVAALMSHALGRTVAVAALSFDAWTRQVKVSHDQDQLAPLKSMYDWYDAHELLGNALTLRAVLGREPRTLLSYFQELAKQPTPDQGHSSTRAIERHPCRSSSNAATICNRSAD
ncbi:MAG TPA: hypothetical protein VF920_15860 [Dongiaceae bacterium]